MGRADTHLAACAITVALLLAAANCAVALADTPDSAGTQNNNTTESNSDPGPSVRSAESKTSDENVKAAESQPAESAHTPSVAAIDSDADTHTDTRTDEATDKKPVDKESCADNHHGKTINTIPTPEAPAVEIAPLPQEVAPALVAPPPADLPPTVPETPVGPDTVDPTVGEVRANHPHSHELPVLSMPFLPLPSMPPHILGASIAPRAASRGEIVRSTPSWSGKPSAGLLRASSADPLPETPAASGLTARGQTPKEFTYGYTSRSLAGMAAGAMPGVVGIMIMTAGGICLGYRQAKAQLALIESADRFLY